MRELSLEETESLSGGYGLFGAAAGGLSGAIGGAIFGDGLGDVFKGATFGAASGFFGGIAGAHSGFTRYAFGSYSVEMGALGVGDAIGS